MPSTATSAARNVSVEIGLGGLDAKPEGIRGGPDRAEVPGHERRKPRLGGDGDNRQRERLAAPLVNAVSRLAHDPHPFEQHLAVMGEPIALLAADEQGPAPRARSSASMRRPMVAALSPVLAAAALSPPCSATCRNSCKSSQLASAMAGSVKHSLDCSEDRERRARIPFFIAETPVSILPLQIGSSRVYLWIIATRRRRDNAAGMDDDLEAWPTRPAPRRLRRPARGRGMARSGMDPPAVRLALARAAAGSSVRAAAHTRSPPFTR